MINLDIGEKIPVLSFLNITYLKNTGMAFSIFRGSNNILFWINLIIVIILLLVVALDKLQTGPVCVSYGLILGGAISNLWDRYFYKGVIDYIDFKIWPVFNIADSAITVAAFIIGYTIVMDLKKKGRG